MNIQQIANERYLHKTEIPYNLTRCHEDPLGCMSVITYHKIIPPISHYGSLYTIKGFSIEYDPFLSKPWSPDYWAFAP